MKKFIALVLSLVMALSLCVPAWGAGEADALAKAIADGATEIELPAGTYDIPSSVAGKTLTITGTEETVINTKPSSGGYFNLGGANITFEGVTIKGMPSGQYNGFAHAGTMAYNKCKFEGTVTIYTNSTFTECTFDLPAGCYIWTAWGANVATYNKCVFNTAGKALLVYHENGTATINVNGCTFNATAGDKAGAIKNQNCAAIEIDNAGKGVGTNSACNFTLNTSGNTYSENFSGEWRIKTVDTAGSITVNGVKYEQLALDGTLMTIDANKNVTLNKSADVAVDETTAATPSKDLTSAEKELVKDVTTSFDSTALTAAATAEAAKVSVSADEIKDAFATVNPSVDVANVEVSVEAYFDVEITDVDTTSNEVSITLDITPMYQVVANDGNDSVTLDKDKLEITTPVVITIDIPDALAELAATKDGKKILYVNHEKTGGPTYVYEAVVEGTAGNYTATFTNPNGFSLFTLSAASNAVASVGSNSYTTLQAAIDAAVAGTNKTVTLLKDVELSAELVIPAGVTLDGQNKTISVAGDTWSTNNADKHLVELSTGSIVKNVTLDSEGKAYGVQAYCVTGVKLDNVTIKNSKGAGLTVNGSDVTAVNLKASGNAWGSVNADPGSGVTSKSKFTVSGAGTNLADATSIWSDGDYVTASTNKVEVSIDGGTYAGDIDVPAAAGSAVVSAGTFTDDVTSYLATGSVYKDGVVVKQTSTPTTGTTSTGTVTSGTVTPVKPALYRLATVGGSMTKLPTVITEIKLTTVSGKIDADVVKYVPNIYSINGDLYIQVAKAAATHALYNNGSYIYLYDAPQTTDAAAIAAYATSVVMDKLVVPADENIDCGDCLKGGKLASYYVSGDSVYYADGMTWAYFNGEFVKYDKDTKVAFQGHTWDAKSIKVKATDVKGVKVPVSIECEKCEKTFSIVGKAKFDNTWVKGVNYTTTPAVDAYGTYYIVLSGATYGNIYVPSTDKVTSADTFDAGIAMYVGMSVMAAAGSAVVIGKKKD